MGDPPWVGDEGRGGFRPAAAGRDKAGVRLPRDRRGVDGAEVAGADDAYACRHDVSR